MLFLPIPVVHNKALRYGGDHIASQATLIEGEGLGELKLPNRLREENVAFMIQNVSTALSKIVEVGSCYLNCEFPGWGYSNFYVKKMERPTNCL